MQDYGTFDEVISHGLDPSELLKNEKKESYAKSPVIDRLTSITSALETPTGEGFIQGSTMDLRDIQELDDCWIHPTESTQQLGNV